MTVEVTEHADAWAARAVLPGRASKARIPRTVLAARMQEHPGLFDPYVRLFGVGQRRMGEVARSVESLARAIGRHLAARAEALADARGLQERLRRADITGTGRPRLPGGPQAPEGAPGGPPGQGDDRWSAP
jgi:hypothetical protein